MGQDSDEEAVIAKPKEEARLSSVSCFVLITCKHFVTHATCIVPYVFHVER